MTEDHQRSSDPRIDTIEKTLMEIASTVKDIDVPGAINEHFTNDHYGLTRNQVKERIMAQDQYEASQREQRHMLHRIAESIDGSEVKDVRGKVTGRTPGLVQKVDDLTTVADLNKDTLEILDTRTNGGTTVTTNLQHEWTRGQKIALGGVLTTLFFSALPGIVILARWIVEVSNS